MKKLIKKSPSEEGRINNELAMTYSHMANATLPSALSGFTTEFGMGSGGSHLLWSPAQLVGLSDLFRLLYLSVMPL